MHYFGRFDPSALRADPLYEAHATGHRRAVLIDRSTGSVHTGLSIEELAPNGVILPHVHSFEEGFYLLSGEATVTIGSTSYALRSGDFGVVKVDTAHAWQARGDAAVRWLQMAAPQPKPAGGERDTFFVRTPAGPQERATPLSIDAAAAHGALLGHFDIGMIPPPAARTTAAKGLEGVFLKWLVDEHFGAVHHRLVFIEYQRGVSIALHDHTFEESYLILSGEVEATLDGKTYRGGPGDLFWTGVGCVHRFAQVGNEPVRWLETFAPQPPRENVFRFVAEWDAKAREIEGGAQ